MMNRRSGVTLNSIVVYVSLFFVFTVFVISMGTNINYKEMGEKAHIYIYEQFDKLQYNIVNSAKNSYSVDNIYGKIIFSNNDEYYYDKEKKVIFKNNGILVKNVENLSIDSINNVSDVKESFATECEESVNNICINITFKKYDKQIEKQIFVAVGDNKIWKKI